MRDSGHIVVVGVAVVEEVGVAEGAEEGEEAGAVVATETEEITTTTMVAMINVITKRGRETILGIAKRIGTGTEIVAIAMTNDGREGEEGAGEEEEEEGEDLAAIVTMKEERREGIGGDVTTGVMVMMEVERDKTDAVKAETEMIGTERIIMINFNESLVGLSFTTNPKCKGVTIALPAQANLIQQKVVI